MGCGSSRRVDVINDDENAPKKVEAAWTTEKIVKSDSQVISRSISKQDLVTPIEIQQSEEKIRDNKEKNGIEEKKEEDVILPNSLVTKSQELIVPTPKIFDKNPLTIPRPHSPLKPILKPPKLPISNLTESGTIVDEPDSPKPLKKSKSARFNVSASTEFSPKEHKHM